MRISNDELTFEEALAKLEKASEALKSEDTGLEDAMKLFDEGLKYYNRCSELLGQAKQKILLFDKAASVMKEMD